MPYRLLGKMASLWKAFSGKRDICCALIVLYSVDSMVGRSIASIPDLGEHIYLGRIRIYRLRTSLPYYVYILHINSSYIFSNPYTGAIAR